MWLSRIISSFFGIRKKSELSKDLQNISFDKERIINKAKFFLKKYTLKDTVNLILENEKVNKKKIYELCLKLKNEKNN